jgi:DNA (cytosine-5)-methyltransferase 1
MSGAPLNFYEFFAGGGMARLGLGAGWRCLFANDFDAKKAAAYGANFGDDHLAVGDVWALDPAGLPGRADLAWASSPCQDLSLAGARRGLDGRKSSAFWGFWRLVEALDREGRAPRAIVIENVSGLASSNGGADFTALAAALAARGYRFGAIEADAGLWLAQSRPRLFVIAVREAPVNATSEPIAPFHSRAVLTAFERLPADLKARWVWWSLPEPARRNGDLAAILEPDDAVTWLDTRATKKLIGMMAPTHRAKLATAKASGVRSVGALFRRVRVEDGKRVQRAEVRFDGLAGCLRTPSGGSSRQFVLVVEGASVRARLITPRESARLMGLGDDYVLPVRTTAALKITGDGVAVPVVRAIAHAILEPLLTRRVTAAA